MAEKLIPVVKADEEEEEELVDPQQALRVCIIFIVLCNINTRIFESLPLSIKL